MKENEKLLKYHLGNINEDFMKEIERIKKSGRRLSNHEKMQLLNKAKSIVYGK